MNTYPTLPIANFGEKAIKPLIKSQYQGGYEQVSLKNTRKIKVFSLGHTLTKAQKDTLESFFDTNQAKEITFNNPFDDTAYTVRFQEDDLEFSLDKFKNYSVSLTLKEV